MDFHKANIPKFNGDNFELWKYQMETFFKVNKLMDVVDGTKKDASDDDKNKAEFVLSQSLEPRILIQVFNKTGPDAKWKALKTIYEQSSEDRIQRLNSEFCSLSMDNDGDVSDFISRMTNISTQLTANGHAVKDSMVIAQLLSKLPEKYQTFVVAWQQSPSSERTLDNLTARLLVEQDRLKTREGVSIRSGAFRAFEPNYGSVRHNKPDNNQHFRGNGNKKRFNGNCRYCGIIGHKERDCKKKKSVEGNSGKNQQQRNHGQQSRPHQKDSNGDTTTHSAFVCSIDGGSTWIADSGASRHVCNNRDLFQELEPHSSVINTATGQPASIEGIGTIMMSSHVNGQTISISMSNVLFVPSFKCNLISLSELEKKGYRVVISDGRVKVFDGSILKAVGKREGTLYHMYFGPPV